MGSAEFNEALYKQCFGDLKLSPESERRLKATLKAIERRVSLT